MASHLLVGKGFLTVQASRSSSDTPQSVAIVEILRVEVVLLIGGHWPPIKLIDLIKMQIS